MSLGRQEAPNIYGITVFHVELCAPQKTKKQNKKTLHRRDFSGGPVAKTPCLNAWHLGLIGGEDPLKEGNGNPLQCSCLENPTDRGRAWRATVRGITESDTTEGTEHACTQETRFCPLETHMLQLKKTRCHNED